MPENDGHFYKLWRYIDIEPKSYATLSPTLENKGTSHILANSDTNYDLRH